ncbi:MAG: phosphoribosylformylglycinamidine synthase subunit PurS [Acidimicrobiales bacterium]|nr:phosphoribosylformylglycinamidine synthase subunit PurS [Acidimicrobiales bacterium]MBO0886006.1 phosphoribosylformylglycinamidine synthase subunit PurS [Acidimicrobiales bacterium]MBO0894018.1 phosphoribosylformylglycinamidine synthase subunit PurS [Acidimicrobiales bacterium]
MRFQALVEVRLREGVADPEGATIEAALPALGFEQVSDLRVGKAIRLVVEASDEAEAERTVAELCQRLLANPVLEETERWLAPLGSEGHLAPGGRP